MRTGSYCGDGDGGGCLGLSKQQRRSEIRGSTNRFINDYGAPCRRMVIATVHPCRPRRRLFLRDRSGQRRRLSSTSSQDHLGHRRGHRVSLNSACSTSRILPDEDDVVRLPSKLELLSPPIAEMEEADKRCVEVQKSGKSIYLLPLTSR